MSEYPNSGALFKNDRKEKETHADYNGDANITCPHCQEEFAVWLNSWIKEGKKGKFMSVSFKPKDAPRNEQPTDEDIPF